MILVNEEKCLGCGECLAWCPEDALSVWALAKVDQDRCTECLTCIDYCPVNAIEEVER